MRINGNPMHAAMNPCRETAGMAVTAAVPGLPQAGAATPGFTLVELLVVVAILGVLAALSIPLYSDYIYRTQVAVTIAELRMLDKEIMIYTMESTKNLLPTSLNDIKRGDLLDRWGHPYQYLDHTGVKGKGNLRRDRALNPLNGDYDLYSLGRDGESKPQLSFKTSRDDIIRAANGDFFGLVSDSNRDLTMKTTSSIIHSIVGRRILGLFIACALLPICGLAFLTLRQVSDKIKEESQKRLKQTSKNTVISILEGLSFIQAEMNNIGEQVHNSPRTGAGEHHDRQRLRLKGVSLLRPDGTAETLFRAPPAVLQLTDTQQQHLAAGKTCLLSTTSAAGPARLFMAIAKDLKRPARGVLLGEINTAYLWELADNSLTYQTAVTILNTQGVQLYSSQTLSRETLTRAVRALPHSYSGRFEFDSEAGPQLASVWSVLFKSEYLFDDWKVIVHTPKHEAFGTLRTYTWTFVLVILFTLLLAYFFSSVQIRRILDPLIRLREGAGNVGKGEFSRRVEITSGDEFEEVGRSFNSMADRLEGHFKTLEDTSNVVRSILIADNEEKIVAAVLDNLHSVIDCHLIGLSLLDRDETGTAITCLSGRPGGHFEKGNQYQTVFRQEELLRLQAEPELLYVEFGPIFQRPALSHEESGGNDVQPAPRFRAGTIGRRSRPGESVTLGARPRGPLQSPDNSRPGCRRLGQSPSHEGA